MAESARPKTRATSFSSRAMPKESGRNDVRSHIAHLAARLMAEDGIEDYALAKRKAARQAGVPGTRDLPGNQEIEAALKLYREIHRPDTHRAQLRELRLTAIRAKIGRAHV